MDTLNEQGHSMGESLKALLPGRAPIVKVQEAAWWVGTKHNLRSGASCAAIGDDLHGLRQCGRQ